MNRKTLNTTSALLGALFLTAGGGTVLWSPAQAEAAGFANGVGSSNALGQVRVNRITLTPNNAAFGFADTIEVGWELTGSDPAVQPTDFDVEVVIHREILGGTTRTVHLSGSARSANINFGTRFLRGVKSVDATVKATATVKAEGKKSQNF